MEYRKERGRSYSEHVDDYLKDMTRHPLMTLEEEITYIGRAQKGDKKAKEYVIRRTIGLVFSIAKRYQGLGLSMQDLVEEGADGLERSIDRYDLSRGIRFPTYASKWIRQAITRALVNTSRTAGISSETLKMLKRFREQKNKMPER